MVFEANSTLLGGKVRDSRFRIGAGSVEYAADLASEVERRYSMKDHHLALKVRALDRALFQAIFRVKWGPLDRLMRVATVVGSAGALWGMVAAVAFILGGFEIPDLLVPWVAVAGSWFAAEGAKHLFDRARPHISDTELAPLIKTPSSSSFPSGHSAAAAAGVLTLSAIYPAFTAAFVICGLLVALSRVYLGVHYPFDVLAGALIGTATATAILALQWVSPLF